MNTIIGAVIALAGVVLVQFVQARREERRWTREASQQSLSRFYDQRRVAHVDFMQQFEHLRMAIWNYDNSPMDGPDPGDDEDLLDSLYAPLTAVRIFGSHDTHTAALSAMEALSSWTRRGRKDGDLVDEAFDNYVDRVRADLGVE